MRISPIGRRAAREFVFGERRTEIIDRVRWEIGPDASVSRVMMTGDTWVSRC